ncbi:MAG: hypothetical protein F6K48_02165 [Okeania sp. SIO3H1]|nr:hypothetical protein [Okeania sp. SIO3H1]
MTRHQARLWCGLLVALEPTFRTTKCSIESGVRRQETGDRILSENHSCRD